MSVSKLPDDTRIAIWLAHRKRCVYCGDLIALRDLAVDHIVPESIAVAAHGYERLKREYGLDTAFQINSPENLVPAHHNPCNASKSDRIFHPGRARYFLELAAAKAASVRRHIESLRLQARKEKLLATLRVALDAGHLTLEDLSELASDRVGFRVSSAVEFFDGSTTNMLNKAEVDELLDKPVLLGATRSIDGVEFVNDEGETTTVRTCREYRIAKSAGYYALTTFAIKMEAFLIAATAVLLAVASAQVASVSYMSNPHAGLADLDLLPKTILPVRGPDDGSALEAISGASLSDLAQQKIITVLGVGSTRLAFEWQHSGAVLEELLRADLDGDGIEELLVRYYIYAVGGTMGVGSVAVLRRDDENALFELVPYEPVAGR